MRCTENPSRGADSYSVLSFIARWARSLYCHLCSSQTVPSVLGNRVSITGVTRVEESTTEERIFGEQCFTSGILPCFPRPLPLREEGGPVRQRLPAALLPSPPEVLEVPGRGLRVAELCPGAVVGSRRRGQLAAGSSRRWGGAVWGRRAGGGRGGGSQSRVVSAWSFVVKRKELDCGEERRRSLHPSQGWREVIRQVQCGGLSCRPAVSCGFHGN